MKMQPFNPAYANVAEFIEARQIELGKTDREIALALGDDFDKVIPLVKKGAMKLPLNKVIELAGVLDLDPADLLKRLLAEYDLGLLAVLEKVLGPVTMSPAEIKLLQAVRKAALGRDPIPLPLDGESVLMLVMA